jgi:Mn-dependent DtxR family transcriptional regulator
MFIRVVDHISHPFATPLRPPPRFTERQGQYLAFVQAYLVLNRRAPAEADFQAFFLVTPPSVHSMILEIERRGLIRRTPRQGRSIELLLDPADLPPLQPIKTTVAGY